jgi:hypothetical protein
MSLSLRHTTFPNIQTFSTSGTWTNPSPTAPRPVLVRGSTAGSGGGSGRRGAAGTNRSGGGGGASGVPFEMWLLSSDLSATVSVTVGAAGIGGASITTDDTDGNQVVSVGTPHLVRLRPLIARVKRMRL